MPLVNLSKVARPVFGPNNLYYSDDWRVMVGKFDLTDYCRGNARTIGILGEHILLQMFGNLDKPTREQKSADLIEVHRDGFRLWEVKTTKTNRLNIQQSHAKGVGRVHDEERSTNYLDSIYGIIAIDQRALPQVYFCGISIEDIRWEFGDSPKAIPIDFIHEFK